MATADKDALYDGITVINGGMDGGNAPSTIGRSKVAFARNITFRGGYPETRPGFRRRPLSFEDASTEGHFEEALFQGAAPFEPYSGGKMLAAMIGGRLFRIDVSGGFKTQDISVPGDLNPATRPKAWFVQAEDFLIVQDGQSAPLIHDGTTTRRVNPSSVPKEIPTGTVMEYSMGRLWVTLPQERSFVAGDLAYSTSGTSAYARRDAVLKFTENDFLNEGGEFGVPADVGVIRAMRSIAVLDTSLGQGPLQVMAERGVFSVDAPLDRTEWKNLERPIQTVSLLGSGALSHEGSVLVNGDIWFRASDGIRSFMVARRDFGTWVNTPLSSEMSPVIDLDDPQHLLHASAVLHDNRYLLTVAPFQVADRGVCWRGLAALDFHNVSGLGARTAPAYDGLWTGLNILQSVQLGDRCFLFVLNDDSIIELWEVTKFDEFDNQGSSTPTRISSFLDTPAFDYADKGWDRKVLHTGDLWVDRLAGTVNYRVQFRSDEHECWTDWASWSVDSKRTTCLDECGFPLSLQPQYRPRMRLPLPTDDCNERVNLPLRHGFKHQVRIAWEGKSRLTRFRSVSHIFSEDVSPACPESEPTDTAGVTCCDTSLWSYRSLVPDSTPETFFIARSGEDGDGLYILLAGGTAGGILKSGR